MKEPIRCFEGKAKPHEAFWRFREASSTSPLAPLHSNGEGDNPTPTLPTNGEGDEGVELELYGYISEYSWLEDEITPKMFKDDLYAFGRGGPVKLKINSPGGDPIAASVMRTILSEYPGPVRVQIDGIAASAAVAVAMSGKSIRIMDTAYMMIHDPYMVVLAAVLDIETLGKMRDALKSVKSGLAETYATRTGLSIERVGRMMTDETWMSASEAVKFGFADEVISGGQAAKAAAVAYVNCLRDFVNVPAALVSASVEPPAVDREAQRLRDYVTIYK
jgi:ATP-dependent Clp protease protease subunit